MPRIALGPALAAVAAAAALAAGCGAAGDDGASTAAAPPGASSAAAGGAAGTAPAGVATPRPAINCGREVAPAQPPRRAVSLTQPATEIMLSLGLADRMVGTASWSDPVLPRLAAENARVPVLARGFPSFERVLEEEPDFAYGTFASAFSDEGVASRDRFERLGVPTYLSPSECAGQEAQQERPYRPADLAAEISDVAGLFGVEERGAALVADLRRRLADARRRHEARPGTRLLWWYSSTRAPYVAGCCGAPGLMTRAIGAENAFADSRQLWPEGSWEAILQRDPDAIVVADLTRGDEGDSAEAKIRFLESDPVARRLTAVRERRYVVLSGSTMDPGIRTVDGVEQLAAGLRRLGLAR